MKRSFIFKVTAVIFTLSLIISFAERFSYAVENGTVQGKVMDKKSKTPLPGITITVEGKDAIGFTDEKGNYSLELPEGTYNLRADLMGYKTAEAKKVVVVSGETNNINFTMEEMQVLTSDEVVVTGERMTIPISRATASVEMVSQKKMELTAGADDAGVILKNTPGVQMESIGGAGSKKIIKIRGQGSPINNNRVLLLIDGVPNQSPRVGTAELSDIPVESIERIEVLKGAASAMYGGAAQAGVINVITKRGNKDPVFSFDSSISTYQHRANANQDWTHYYSVYHSWGGSWWDYTISGSYLFSKGLTYAEKGIPQESPAKLGYISVNYPGFPGFDKTKSLNAPPYYTLPLNKIMDKSNLDDTENYNLNASFGLKPFKGNYFKVILSVAHRSQPQAFGVDTSTLIILKTDNKKDSLNFTDDWDITPKLKYALKANMAKETDIGDMFFFNNVSSQKTAAELIAANASLPDQLKFKAGVSPVLSPFHYWDRTWSVDNSLTYTSDFLEPDGNSITVGQSYRWERVDLPASKNLGLQQFIKNPVDRAFTSLYGQATQKFGKLNANIGARWEQVRGFVTEDHTKEISPRFALNYELSPGNTLRASVGRAFRVPEYSHVNFFEGQGGTFYGNPELKYEIVWSYELGFKFLTKYVSGDIAYFYSDYSNTEAEVPFLATNPRFVDLRVPGNLKFFKIYEQNREILGGATSRAIDQVLNYWIEKGLTNRNRLIDYQKARTWINRGAAAYQGFDNNFDISIPSLPNFGLSLSYLFNRAVAGNPNPFDFSQGSKPRPVVVPKGTGPREPVPVSLLEKGGERLIDVPTHTFRVTPSYRFQNGLIVTINGRFKSNSGYKSPYSTSGFVVQKEHWVWDIAAIQPLFKNKLKVKFAIENIFSKLYYEVGTIPSTVARYELGVTWSF